MKPAAYRPMDVGVAVAIMLACALASGWALVAFTKPGDFDERVAAVEQTVADAKAIVARKAGLEDFPPDAVCTVGPAAASQALKSSLASLGPAVQLERMTVQVTEGEGARSGGLEPYTVRLEGEGSYEAALRAVDGLSALRPIIFIDTVDITSKISFVKLSVSGRVYCLAGN